MAEGELQTSSELTGDIDPMKLASMMQAARSIQLPLIRNIKEGARCIIRRWPRDLWTRLSYALFLICEGG